MTRLSASQTAGSARRRWDSPSASVLGDRWNGPGVIVGTLVLATLTGVPNVLAAVRLARNGRRSAVLSEALNSNTANVLVGLAIPALAVGLGTVSGTGRLAAWWLLAITVAAIALAAFRGGLLRWEGAVVIAGYVAFVMLVVLQ